MPLKNDDEVPHQSSSKSIRSKNGPMTKSSGRPNNKLARKCNHQTATYDDTMRPTADEIGGIDGQSFAKAMVSPMEVLGPRNSPVPTCTNEARMAYAKDVKTGMTIAIPLSEVGKASRFGDAALSENTKCNVFEVVLQSKEASMCPACARSPKRAMLPAHARGCFGMS